jgi:Uma2 family endonuclease
MNVETSSATVTVAEQWFRADDLLRPGSPEKFVEVIEGELIEMTPAGWEHNDLALALHRLLHDFCRSRAGMRAGGDNDGFLVQRDPDVLLSPDASLHSKRPSKGRPWLEFGPELVVEVVSPSNTRTELAYKKGKYFGAGTQQFWIVDPADRSLEIVFPDGRRLRWEGNATIAGEGIAEGLRVDLAELFKA